VVKGLINIEGMETIIGVGVVFAFLLYQLYKEQQESKEKDEEMQRLIALQEERDKVKKEKDEVKDIPTRDLLIKILEEMDCQPENDKDGRIGFQYQGICFLAEASNNGKFVRIIYPFSHRVSLLDIDEFSRVRRVLNELNNVSGCALFYQEYEDKDEIGIHISKHFLFTSDIPMLHDYLRCVLTMLFRAQQELVIGVEKEKVNEEKSIKQ